MNHWQLNHASRLALPITFFLLLITLLFIFLSTRPAQAIDCNVPTGYGTIQAAIDDTNCDTIIIAAGTYAENITVDRSLTLQGAGISTTIDGGGTDRTVTVDGSGITVYMSGLRVINGNATSASTNGRFGGGVLVTGDATLHGENLTVENNVASTAAQTGFGGGVAINTGSAYLTSTVVHSNMATLRDDPFTGPGTGGGLYVSGNSYLSLVDSQVLTNVASIRAGSSTLAAGGGLRVGEGATAYLRGNTWQANVARGHLSDACSCIATSASGDGGAIAVYVTTGTAELSVTDDTFINNIANASDDDYGGTEKAGGGAISLLASNTAGQITGTLDSVTMIGNIAKSGSGTGEGRGGGVYARGATLIVHNATLLDNQAALADDGSGGGIYIREPVDDYLEVINTVLAGNMALGNGDGAQLYINYTTSSFNEATVAHTTIADDTLNGKQGLYYNGPDTGDQLTVINTIIANHAIGIFNINDTDKATARYILFDGNTDNHPSAGTTAFPGDDETTWVLDDPAFVDAANGDYHIGSGSAAIDAGTDAGITTDIDGQSRPQGSGFDIGADESIYFIFVPLVVK